MHSPEESRGGRRTEDSNQKGKSVSAMTRGVAQGSGQVPLWQAHLV